MTRPSLLGALLALVVGFAPARARGEWTSALAAEVGGAAHGFEGELSLYVHDLRTGEEFALDAERPTYLSSAIKLVVMLEVLREFDAGQLDPNAVVQFGPDDVRDGVGPIGLGRSGRRFTIGELLELMMDHSDNAAADMLMGRVGTAALEELTRDRGVRFGPIETLIGERRHIYGLLDARGLLLSPAQIYELGHLPTIDARAERFSQMVGHSPPLTGLQLEAAFEAFYEQGVNSAPMREVGKLLGQIARCDGLSRASCSRAHDLMRRCQTGHGRILAGLPRGAAWAHKTGTQERRACDVGILFARPDRPVVVAACAREFWDVRHAERLFAAVGRAVWRALAPDLGSARVSPASDGGRVDPLRPASDGGRPNPLQPRQ